MNRRRFVIVTAVALLPLVAFVVAYALLAGNDGETDISAREATTSTEATTTSTSTTTTAVTTTTVVPPRLGPASPFPSIPQPGEPVAATTAAGLADQLTNATAAITAKGADLAKQAHIYQVATRALAAKPDLREPAYARLDAHLVARVRGDVDAAAKLRQLVGKPRTALPPWRIVEPAPPDELLGYYKAAETEFGVPWHYLAAINLVESRMGRIRGTSEAGAQGPMQFLPATWEQYGAGGDINSYKDAIAAAARYLKRNGAPGDMRNALWNYNHSDLYVEAVLAYGDQMKVDESAYYGYYHWQVYYVTTAGDIWLPVGYGT